MNRRTFVTGVALAPVVGVKGFAPIATGPGLIEAITFLVISARAGGLGAGIAAPFGNMAS